MDLYYEIQSTVRAAGSADGIVLLDLTSGKYQSLNPVGARVWLGLADCQSRDEILNHLMELFEASREQIILDVDSLLKQLTKMGLLVPSPSRPRSRFEIAVTRRASLPAAFPTIRMEPPSGGRGATPGRLFRLAWFLKSLAALLYIDLLTRTKRFAGICLALGRNRPQSKRPASPLMWEISAAVNRAASFYYKRRWCLQRSAACAYLLRRHGFSAELVMGVQVMPFIAHAWVELDGEVINDTTELTQAFTVLDRI